MESVFFHGGRSYKFRIVPNRENIPSTWHLPSAYTYIVWFMRMRISSSLRQSTNLYEGRGDKLTSSSILSYFCA